MFYLGIVQALGLTILISIFNVFLRIAVQEWHINPVAFTCYCLMMSAFILTLAAGPGKLVKETLKSPYTWVYSVILISTYIVDTYVMLYVSATEASFFSRLSIPISLTIAWIFFNRKPKKSDLWGIYLIMGALVWLVMIQPTATLHLILLTVSLSAFFQTLQFVLAETHKQASQAVKQGNIRDEWRVTGLVTFISSSLFLSTALIAATTKHNFNLNISFIPDLNSFVHANTIFAALFYGSFILPFIRYFKWSATQNLKAENMLIFMAFIPLCTYSLERVVSFFTYIPSAEQTFSPERNSTLFMIACLITFGAGLTTFLRVRAQIKNSNQKSLISAIKDTLSKNGGLAIHHSKTAQDDYEIIAATLEYTHGDTKKASDLLEIPENTLNVLHAGKGSYALVEQESQKIARLYRYNIASKDALTSLLNRAGFLTEFKAQLDHAPIGTLLYIDLNKFKPVNDTYGHEAGDFVLTTIAKRFQKHTPKQAVIARLGGDEFVIFLPNTSKKEAHIIIDTLKAQCAEEIAFNNQSIYVGCAIGAIETSATSSAEDLLNIADHAMYEEKHTS